MRSAETYNQNLSNKKKIESTSNLAQLRVLLQTEWFNKLDLAAEVETGQVSAEFDAFLDKFWEKGSGRELVAKYLQIVLTRKDWDAAQKERELTVMHTFLSNLHFVKSYAPISLEEESFSNENTVAAMQERLRGLSPEDNTVGKFFDYLETAQSAPKEVQAFKKWVKTQPVTAKRLDDWYDRIRNKLLMSGRKEQSRWLELQIFRYIQRTD